MAHLGIKKANENHKATHILNYSIIYLVHPNSIFSPSFLSACLPFCSRRAMRRALASFQREGPVLLTHAENLIQGSVLANWL